MLASYWSLYSYTCNNYFTVTAFINSYTPMNSLDYMISKPILKPIRGWKARHYILKEYQFLGYDMCTWNHNNIKSVEFVFRTTYDEVLAKSEKMWQYERYQIIMDFQDRIFANLDIVFPIFKCIRKCKKRRYKSVWKYWCSILYIYIGKLFLNMNLLRSKNFHFWVRI